jgi:hypothetical protein
MSRLMVGTVSVVRAFKRCGDGRPPVPVVCDRTTRREAAPDTRTKLKNIFLR